MTDPLMIACPHCNALNRVPGDRLGDAPQCGRCHQALFTAHPLAIESDAALQAHALKSELPLLVDFWAPWCGPCRSMAPAFEQAANTLKTQAQLVKLDTEAHPQASAPYNIRSIPTMVVFKEGKELGRISGAMPASEIIRWVNSVI